MKRLGQLNYYRGKGQQWIEMVRAWVMPAVLGGGFVKYIGIETEWALVVVICLPMLVESLGVLWGWFLYRRGAVRADYELAMLMDPWKVNSLALLTSVKESLASIERQLLSLKAKYPEAGMGDGAATG